MQVAEYLCTSFEDRDIEFVDGELLERNVGEVDHADTQGRTCSWFLRRRDRWGVYPVLSVRTQVSPTRYRIPDVTVVRGPKPAGRIVTTPALLVIEILSPEDRAGRMDEKIDDYLRFGIPNVWVIDPKTGRGHMHTGGRRIPVEDGRYRIAEPPIEMNFADLFTDCPEV
jgi:Uma2 family endonuclease